MRKESREQVSKALKYTENRRKKSSVLFNDAKEICKQANLTVKVSRKDTKMKINIKNQKNMKKLKDANKLIQVQEETNRGERVISRGIHKELKNGINLETRLKNNAFLLLENQKVLTCSANKPAKEA